MKERILEKIRHIEENLNELEEIVRQSLPYLRVPKGTAVNAFNKFMEKDKIDDFLKTNLN